MDADLNTCSMSYSILGILAMLQTRDFSQARNRYIVEVGQPCDDPVEPRHFEPKLKRGDRIRITKHSPVGFLQNCHAYVTDWDTRTGMFWVYIPTISEADGRYRRYKFGPYCWRDIEQKKLVQAPTGRFTRAPDLDKIFARFKFKRQDRKPSRFTRLEEQHEATED